MIIEKGLNIYVPPTTKYIGTLEVGHCSIIGNFNDSQELKTNTAEIVNIGKNLKIGAFCKISNNVTIGNDCMIGDNCQIYHTTTIGDNVIIETGSRVSARCRIGNNVIISGLVSQRVVMEDNVRYLGRIAHIHYNSTLDWKTTSEPSPIFRKGCVIGVNALIIGDVEIGENAYIAAGEIVRCNIPPDSVYYKGKIHKKEFFRGIIV